MGLCRRTALGPDNPRGPSLQRSWPMPRMAALRRRAPSVRFIALARRGERGRHGGSRQSGSGQSDSRLIRAALRLGERGEPSSNCGERGPSPLPKDVAADGDRHGSCSFFVCGSPGSPSCPRIPSVLGGFKPSPSGRQRLRPTIFPFGFAEFLARAKSPAFAVLR
jgi:hypothetical protein